MNELQKRAIAPAAGYDDEPGESRFTEATKITPDSREFLSQSAMIDSEEITDPDDVVKRALTLGY